MGPAPGGPGGPGARLQPLAAVWPPGQREGPAAWNAGFPSVRGCGGAGQERRFSVRGEAGLGGRMGSGKQGQGKASAARLALVSWAVSALWEGSQCGASTAPCPWRGKEAFLAQGRGLRLEWGPWRHWDEGGSGGTSRERSRLGWVCQARGFWLLASFQEEAESGRLGWGLPSHFWA